MSARIHLWPKGTCTLIASMFAFPLLWSPAHAVTIAVPTEAVDSEGDILEYSFSELNETALDGQTISIDFVFAEPISVHDLQDVGESYVYFTINLYHDSELTFESVARPTGYLFDENGPLAPVTLIRAAAGYKPGWVGNALGFGPEELTDGILMSGVHFNITLPNAGGVAQIERGTLHLLNPSEFPTTPEPGTLGLLGLGLLGLGLTRRRALPHADHRIDGWWPLGGRTSSA